MIVTHPPTPNNLSKHTSKRAKTIGQQNMCVWLEIIPDKNQHDQYKIKADDNLK